MRPLSLRNLPLHYRNKINIFEKMPTNVKSSLISIELVVETLMC